MATPSDPQRLLVAEIRESFGRVAYTHKTHEKAADIKRKRDSTMRITQIVVSSLTTAGVFAVLISNQWWLKVCTAVVAALMSFLTTYAKNFREAEGAKEHQAAASRLWLIREQYVSLLTDLQGGSITVAEAREVRDDLQKRLAEIYETAPRTNGSAYKEAQRALQVSQELTFSDSEIDAFLPGPLRLTEPPSPSTSPAGAKG